MGTPCRPCPAPVPAGCGKVSQLAGSSCCLLLPLFFPLRMENEFRASLRSLPSNWKTCRTLCLAARRRRGGLPCRGSRSLGEGWCRVLPRPAREGRSRRSLRAPGRRSLGPVDEMVSGRNGHSRLAVWAPRPRWPLSPERAWAPVGHPTPWPRGALIRGLRPRWSPGRPCPLRSSRGPPPPSACPYPAGPRQTASPASETTRPVSMSGFGWVCNPPLLRMGQSPIPPRSGHPRTVAWSSQHWVWFMEQHFASFPAVTHAAGRLPWWTWAHPPCLLVFQSLTLPVPVCLT